MTATRSPQDAPYTLRQLQQMLGISPRVIGGLVRSGFVTPARGERNEYRFSFQDLVLIRTAHALQGADIPTRRILKSLRHLKESLPAELPLSGLRITAVGDRVAVREGTAHWEPESGQLLMDFEVAAVSGGVALMPAPAPIGGHGAAEDTQALFEEARSLEEADAPAAEAAYRRVLAIAPDNADAWLNLGAMMCESGRCAEAVPLYEAALAQCPSEPLLYFNLAIALEDMGRADEALQRYAQCLAEAPDFADAHFNAARLHEQLGHQQMALRHFNAYRRLQKR